MKAITYNKDKSRIEITFPYSEGMISKIKEKRFARWSPEDRVWVCPATLESAKIVIDFGKEYGFEIGDNVIGLLKPVKKNLTLREKLYPYQREDVDFLHTAGGRAIIASDVGTGKTVVAMAWMAETPSINRALVLCPASVVYKWQEEIQTWLGWSTQVITKSKERIDPNVRVVIMSYTMMTLKAEVRETVWDCMIADECHYLSSPDARRSRMAALIPASKIMMLSGTPFLNRPAELWHILYMLYPNAYPNKYTFWKKYCDGHIETIYRRDGAVRFYDKSGISKQNIPDLKNKLSKFMVRRLKQEVLSQLPELRRSVIKVDVDNQYSDLIKQIRESRKTDRATALTKLAELRKLIGAQKVVPTVELAENILHGGEKVVIYAHHKDVVADLKNRLMEYGVDTIVGDNSSEERQATIQKFQNEETPRVLIISSAGGEGINLFASSNLIFAEREWNPGKEMQIEGRVHRVGQTKGVMVYYLVARGGVDERIHNLIERKRETVGEIMTMPEIETDILEAI